MILEPLIDLILAGIIVAVICALILCVGSAVWAGSEPGEPEPWSHPKSDPGPLPSHLQPRAEER